MSAVGGSVEHSAVLQHARQLCLLTVGAEFAGLAEEAARRGQGHVGYLETLLGAEVDERGRKAVERRIQEARFPAVKTLEEFDFESAPHIPAARLRGLAAGGYLERSEPVIFIGDTGTGKSHLAVGLGVAACRERRRVRFTTAAELVTELMPESAAELLFQVVSGRAERSAIIVTTNLPFSEWTTMFPNARLCKALLDRLTDRAHIVETGSESYRFRRTLARKGGRG